MGKEIERKYLVNDNSYRIMAEASHHIIQGYLSRDINATVRVRIVDDRAFLTVKGKTSGLIRDEWEYQISLGDAYDMIERCCSGTVIDKTRYIVPYAGYRWEVDEFETPRHMIVAEVELPDEKVVPVLPDFIGDEVTGDARYYNSNL